LVGILVCTAPFIFESFLPPVALAIIFIIINSLTLKGNKLKGIHYTERVSYGTIYFPISFAILVLWFWEKDAAILLTAMLIMSFGDPIASWVGESVKTQNCLKSGLIKINSRFYGNVYRFIYCCLNWNVCF